MKTSVNKIRNPDFTEGKAGPHGWVWSSTNQAATWRRGLPDSCGDARGLTITAPKHLDSAGWSQTVVCKPAVYYRIEAVVTCDLEPSTGGSESRSGLVLSVQPQSDDQPRLDSRTTPALLRSSQPTTIRTYFQAPEGVRRLKIAVGVSDAAGTASIHLVRFIRILEPDEIGHPLAIPPPPHTQPAPRRARSVCVCTEQGNDRPIVQRLAACLGADAVTVTEPTKFRASRIEADALLLPDTMAPAAIRSMASLIRLARDRIVMISPTGFVALASETLGLRGITQDDDPIHAKIMFANQATRGFALHDVFPFAHTGRTPGSFVQHQFRNTTKFKTFCKNNKFTVLLASMCDRDETSDQPIALFKETPGGGLYVLDIQPAEAACSTQAEANLPLHVVLSILGQTRVGLGQFTSPARTEPELRRVMRDMADRFAPFVVHDAPVPVDEVVDQLVTMGRDDESAGQPLQPKPVILVRTGLAMGEAESTYGALNWFKQLVRMEPHTCPYAPQLLTQFRLAWLPQIAPWRVGDGWRHSDEPTPDATSIEVDSSRIAALIDIVPRPINRIRVLLPSDKGGYRRYAKWLPRLYDAFGAGSYFTWSVPSGATWTDRDRFDWRHLYHELEVLTDSRLFSSGAYRDVLKTGGEVIRIEIPRGDADFVSNSIERTDVTATLLEHVVGMQFGLIAVNRRTTPIRFDAFPPLGPGQPLILDSRDPALRTTASQAG